MHPGGCQQYGSWGVCLPHTSHRTHTISAEKEGFQRLGRTAVEVRIGQRLDLNLQLELGDVQQIVTVTAEPPLPETSTAEHVGSHARTDDQQVLEKWNGIRSDLGWLLFGLGYHSPDYGSYPFYCAVASAYEPPPILRKIAAERADGVLHKELKRTRHRWRFHVERNGEVYKATYLRDQYAVGSDQGGLLQPVQQHSWDVTWKVPDPRGVHNTLFTVHPYSGLLELQAYFTLAPDPAPEVVYRSKKSCDSPDKLLGGSPYGQIFQERDTVIVLRDIAPGTRFPHINGFFSKDL